MGENKAKYRVTEKHISGIEINKLTIETLDGSKKTFISVDDLAKLANSGKIEDVSTLIDTIHGRMIIDYHNKLSEIPVAKGMELRIQCRIVDVNGKCIGYKAVNNSGKAFKLSIGKTWELASAGCIENVDAKIVYNKRALIGRNGLSLNELPILIAE